MFKCYIRKALKVTYFTWLKYVCNVPSRTSFIVILITRMLHVDIKNKTIKARNFETFLKFKWLNCFKTTCCFSSDYTFLVILHLCTNYLAYVTTAQVQGKSVGFNFLQDSLWWRYLLGGKEVQHYQKHFFQRLLRLIITYYIYVSTYWESGTTISH